jgi:hypothetical protein
VLVRGALPERDPPLPRLLQGLAGLLGNVARRTPLAVLLDDVHFADPSSWEALRYFARHLDDARLLVIATTRPAELSTHDVAAQVLFELEQDELVSRVDVAPLGRAGIAELAEAVIGYPPPGPLVDWIAERSQGNPLFAIGLLRALIEEQGDLAQPHLHRLPEGLTERVTSELRRFDEPEREILELLAVVGRPVSFGDVAALSGGALDDVGPILSDLVNSGTVIEEERGTELSYEVHHPLVRDVIYQATGGAQRLLLCRPISPPDVRDRRGLVHAHGGRGCEGQRGRKARVHQDQLQLLHLGDGVRLHRRSGAPARPRGLEAAAAVPLRSRHRPVAAPLWRARATAEPPRRADGRA